MSHRSFPIPFYLLFTIFTLLFPSQTWANAAPSVFAEMPLSLWWSFPFLGLLLSLAFGPLCVPNTWHRIQNIMMVFWGCCILIPLGILQGWQAPLQESLTVFVSEYFPFITLIATLYTLAGGIHIKIHLKGTPLANMCVLMVTSLTASLIGTTGAAMVFIRPLLHMNQERQYKTHTVIFFIFLVCNIGGALSPLGDPPLFLGFLEGIPFLWPMQALWMPFLLIWAPLLFLYLMFDLWYWRKESQTIRHGLCIKKTHAQTIVSLRGTEQLLICAGLMGVLIVSSQLSTDHLTFFHLKLPWTEVFRDTALLFLLGLSLYCGKAENRQLNQWSWEPLKEILPLFAAIFITAAPLFILLHHPEGILSELVSTLQDTGGMPRPRLYFWTSGLLSAFLDNAPTYLVFFHMAGGDPSTLIGPLVKTLTAISLGAVLMGALTYIGNAPNLLVKEVVRSLGISMPSFLGYIAWSFSILLPLFLILTVLLF